MKNRENGYITEKIKTIVLVVLFLQTILLLYFFWHDITLGDIRFNKILTLGDSTVETEKPEKLIIPSHIDICLDNDTYARIDSAVAEYWDTDDEENADGNIAILQGVTSAISTGDEFVEEITDAQYEEVMNMLSVKAVFNYYLPYREYFTMLGISNPPGTEMIESISEIGFSTGSAESMFIYDGTKDKYYRIVSNFNSDELLGEIKTKAASGNTSYYPLESFVGADFTSGILIPQFIETDITEGTAYREMGANSKHSGTGDVSEAGTELARAFFSDTFDFVRRVEEESGRVTYIYGYGEKLLTIYENGEVEYRADVSDGNDSGYMSAFRTALSTIAELGGFKTVSGNEFTPYLHYAAVKNERDKAEPVYVFEFGMLLDGEKVYFEDKNVVVAEICGGQVSYFSRNYIETPDTSYRGGMREAHSAVNVLAQNYEYIYNAVTALAEGDEADGILKNKRMTSDSRFEIVASLISDMSIGYFFDEENSVLKPCYVISLFDEVTVMYFDIETAEPVGDGIYKSERVANGLV